jgi:hypothetical protein
MNDRATGVVRLRNTLAIAVAAGAIVCCVIAIACSSSGGGGIVGVWETPSDGGATNEIYFNSDGTCGFIEKSGNVTACTSGDCTYSYDGTTLTITQGDGGAGSKISVQASISGNTLNVTVADGGTGTQLTRVSSGGANSCG